MGRGKLSKSLIQFSVEGQGCVPSLLFDLRPNCGGGNEDNGNLLQKVPCTFCYTQCPQPCSRLPANHASARDFWTLTGKSGSVSCGVTAPSSGSWCSQGSVCVLQESVSPVRYKFWQLYGGLMVTSSKRAYAIPRSTAPRAPAPAPAAVHCWPVYPQETPKRSSVPGSITLLIGQILIFLCPGE